jgi:hypothetical protein
MLNQWGEMKFTEPAYHTELNPHGHIQPFDITKVIVILFYNYMF